MISAAGLGSTAVSGKWYSLGREFLIIVIVRGDANGDGITDIRDYVSMKECALTAKYDEAAANLKAMETTAAAAKAQYDMAIEGARREDREAAEALVKQASGAVSEVESYISDAMQYSPIDGEISTVIAQQGELISAGYPVVTLLDMNDLWVTFNIKEDLLPKIKIGSVLQAYVPGIGRTIELKVYYMAVQAEYATWSATRTKGDFDIRTFEVKARPEGRIEGLRPGMTVTVNWDEIR